MKTSQRSIDYLDLAIPVQQNHTELFKHTLEEFEENHDYIRIKPKIRKQTLMINSHDLIPFLGYLDISEWSEIERHRFRADAKNSLESLLKKTLSPDFRSHYQWSLTAFENLKWGRLIEDE